MAKSSVTSRKSTGVKAVRPRTNVKAVRQRMPSTTLPNARDSHAETKTRVEDANAARWTRWVKMAETVEPVLGEVRFENLTPGEETEQAQEQARTARWLGGRVGVGAATRDGR